MGSNSQTVHLNTPSTGMLQRSHPKSIFRKVEIGSEREKTVFPFDGTVPYIHQYSFTDHGYNNYKDTKGKVHVIILQVLVFGQNSLMVECVEPKYLEEPTP